MESIHTGFHIFREVVGCESHSSGANRTPRQALLRVFQLMLEAYCAQHKHDRLARRQLERVTNARNAEPPHAD